MWDCTSPMLSGSRRGDARATSGILLSMQLASSQRTRIGISSVTLVCSMTDPSLLTLFRAKLQALSATARGRATCRPLGFTATGYKEIALVNHGIPNGSNVSIIYMYPDGRVKGREGMGDSTASRRWSSDTETPRRPREWGVVSSSSMVLCVVENFFLLVSSFWAQS